MMPLALADLNEEFVIKKISGNQDIKLHLENLGFVVGGRITIMNSLAGNLIVDVKGSRVALSDELARKIMI